MMQEDEMKDKILQELQNHMDQMSAGKPEKKETIMVASAMPNPPDMANPSPSPTMADAIKKTIGNLGKKAEGKLDQPTYTEPDRNKTMKEIELQSMADETDPNEPEPDDDADDMDNKFSGFVRSKRRG